MANSTGCLLTYWLLLLSVMFNGQQYGLFADVLVVVVVSDVSWPTVSVVC